MSQTPTEKFVFHALRQGLRRLRDCRDGRFFLCLVVVCGSGIIVVLLLVAVVAMLLFAALTWKLINALSHSFGSLFRLLMILAQRRTPHHDQAGRIGGRHFQRDHESRPGWRRDRCSGAAAPIPTDRSSGSMASSEPEEPEVGSLLRDALLAMVGFAAFLAYVSHHGF